MSEFLGAAKSNKPPAVRARKGRGPSRSPNKPLASFDRWVALPSVIVYVTVCALVLTTLNMMTSQINRIDTDRSAKALEAAVNTFALHLGGQVAKEAAWTEAYLNTYVEFSPAWLDVTWGNTARTGFPYDTAIVTDAFGQILFGESIGGPIVGRIGDHFTGSATMMASLGDAVVLLGQNAMVANFAGSHGNVAALAAAVIHSSSGQMTIPGPDRRILWLAKHIDERMLNDLARRFQVPLPRLDSSRPAGAGEQIMGLADADGTLAGQGVWRPLRPGDAAFLQAASLACLVLLVIGALVLAVLAAFRRSVQRRAEADERDWVSARYDPSTGLINRFGLEESIGRHIPRKSGELNVAVAYIEFEGLKDIAGSYGQETVEALLDRLADLIDARVARQAEIARLGPDEFALCRVGQGAGVLIRGFSKSVIDIVGEAIELGDLRLKIKASIGVAEAVVTHETIGVPIGMAAAALQHARETGGSQVVEYEPSLEENRQKRLALQADIRRGLEAGEFDLVYQPIFDFNSQTLLGVEALMRWPRREGGPMSPGDFIPAAEASGLIEELGLFALRRACRDIAPFASLKLSVNVSTVQFRSPALASRIDAILQSTGFPAHRLQLEITESFLLDQPERAKAAIEELRGRGITIAMDDFGTGFSSVGYLRQFSFDRVKLDRTLVDEIDLDPVKAALVESTMLIAFAMGLAVTAEGVERREEAAALTRLGCREFQGYLFSRPLPLETLARLIRRAQESANLRKAS